jgi:ankyrin repeat protein
MKEGFRILAMIVLGGFMTCAGAMHPVPGYPVPMGMPLLHGVVWFGNQAVVEQILSCTEDPKVLVNSFDRKNQTPLHVAVKRGFLQICAILLGAGADPMIQNGDGKTAYALAKELWGDASEITALIRNNAIKKFDKDSEIEYSAQSRENDFCDSG